jgi:hypothetical protein
MQHSSLFCWITCWSLNSESTSPAVAYASGGNDTYIRNVKPLYLCIPFNCTHPDMTPVIRNVRNHANRQNQVKHAPLGNSQLLRAKSLVFIPAGKRDSSQRGSSIASAIQGQNSTPSSMLYNSHIVDLAQHVTSTPSTTLWLSINTLTTTPGTSGLGTATPWRTSQQQSTCHIVCSAAAGIGCTPTTPSSLEILPTTPSLSQKPAWLIQFHCKRDLHNGISDRVSANWTAGAVNTSIIGIRQTQHFSIYLIRHDVSLICYGQTTEALSV